jgi:four helix bundle protein
MDGYKKLIVWQKSMDLVVAIYALTEQFPKSELFGLTSQMRRSSVSIPSNIAEGSRRKTIKDKAQFLHIAFGSGSELETQIEIVKRLPFGERLDYSNVDIFLPEVLKMLNKMLEY